MKRVGWILLVAGSIGLFLMGWNRRLGVQQDLLWEKRLERTALYLIQKGKQSQDDLLIQQTLQALASAPGIARATIGEKDQKPLVLHFQDRERSVEQRIWEIFLLLVNLGAGGLIALRMQRQAGQTKRLTEEVQALRSLAEEARLGQARHEQALAREQHSARLRLQTALKKVTEPLLFLDQNQFLTAISPAAVDRLRLRSTLPLGLPWHEVEELKNLGSLLDASWSKPGQTFEAEVGSVRLRLETFADQAGCWVHLG